MYREYRYRVLGDNGYRSDGMHSDTLRERTDRRYQSIYRGYNRMFFRVERRAPTAMPRATHQDDKHQIPLF